MDQFLTGSCYFCMFIPLKYDKIRLDPHYVIASRMATRKSTQPTSHISGGSFWSGLGISVESFYWLVLSTPLKNITVYVQARRQRTTPAPIWKILVNWDDYSHYKEKKMFQTTNQFILGKLGDFWGSFLKFGGRPANHSQETFWDDHTSGSQFLHGKVRTTFSLFAAISLKCPILMGGDNQSWLAWTSHLASSWIRTKWITNKIGNGPLPSLSTIFPQARSA